MNKQATTIDSEEETAEEYEAEQTIELIEENEWVASHYHVEEETY